MKTDTSQLEHYLKQIKNMGGDLPKFFEGAVRDIASELLGRVRDLTPVEENETVQYYGKGGKILTKQVVGGALRRGWTADRDIEPAVFIQGEPVKHSGGTWSLTISNNISYANFVESGYRRKSARFVPFLGDTDDDGIVTGAMLKPRKVDGKHMLQISVAQVEKMAPARLEQLLEEFLEGLIFS